MAVEPLSGLALGAAIKALIDGTLKPIAEATLKALGARGAKANPARPSELLSDYLTRTYTALSTIPTLALQHRPMSLLQLYVPLTVTPDGSRKPRQHIRLDRFHKAFLPRYRKVLLTDTAGMGKSTLLKFLFLSCVHHRAVVPIFVELRRLTKDVDILDYLARELAPSQDALDRDIAAQLLRTGGFVFLLDGFDEVSTADRDSVGTSLQSFLARIPEAMILVSSRPEAPLSLFKDFFHFSIVGLSIEEAVELLARYDESGETSSAIISQLKGKTLTAVRDFLSNPLLVSLLFRAYEHKKSIPLRKHIFYRQVYDALFDSHDNTKGVGYLRPKKSGLDIDEFHRLMRTVGIMTLSQGKIGYGHDGLLTLLREARSRCTGMVCKESELLSDILDAVPLFVRDGTEYKWGHKSLQDYFAATFISWDSKVKQEQLLTRLYNSPLRVRFHNLLDLFADIDPRAFRHVIGSLLLRDILAHYSASYSPMAGAMPDKDLLLRREVSFGRQIYFVPSTAIGGPNRNDEASVFSDIFFQEGRQAPDLLYFILLRLRDGSGIAIGQTGDWAFTADIAQKAIPELGLKVTGHWSVPAESLPPGFFEGDTVIPLSDDPQARCNMPSFIGPVTRVLEALHLPRVNAHVASTLLDTIEAEKHREASDDIGFFESLEM